jgi:hypothetical protein
MKMEAAVAQDNRSLTVAVQQRVVPIPSRDREGAVRQLMVDGISRGA